MKILSIVFPLFCSNLLSAQSISLTESAIEKYVIHIDELKRKSQLVKVSYPDMSGCGGAIDGYYSHDKLVFINATYNSESGFISRTCYIDESTFLKIVYHEHYIESEESGKEKTIDTLHSVTFSNPHVYFKEADKKIISTTIDQSFTNRLLSCGKQMKTELQKVVDQVDSLRFVKEMPYICEGGIKNNKLSTGCGDDLYWNVVRMRANVIELLIDRLDDTTTTETFIPNFGGYYTTADIAYSALHEIIHDIPTFDLLGVPFDKDGCGYCSYWQHLNKSLTNRQHFKDAVRIWYHKNQGQLVWVKSNDFATCDCSGAHPNGGHYIIKTAKNKDK